MLGKTCNNSDNPLLQGTQVSYILMVNLWFYNDELIHVLLLSASGNIDVYRFTASESYMNSH